MVGRNEVLRSARDAVRYFGRHFRESAESARQDGKADIAEALAGRSTALLGSVDLDEGAPAPSYKFGDGGKTRWGVWFRC